MEPITITKIVELFKLIISGLDYAKDKIKSIKDKQIIRKIIQIQLCLEDIIDNARRQIEIIKNLEIKEMTSGLRNVLIGQRHKILQLDYLLNDDVSENIFKLFLPENRRNIYKIIRVKEGALYDVIRKLSYLESGKGKITKEEIFQRIDEQEKVLSELEECSEKISAFIGSNFNVKEIFRFI